MTRTITAFFDTRAEAQAAADRLRHMGLGTADVAIHDAGAGAGTERMSGSATGEPKGFLASLSDFFVPDDERTTYEEGVRRGGSVLTVRAEESNFDAVSDVLEEAGAVDLDTREAEWRSQGWSGQSETLATTGAGMAGSAGSTTGSIVGSTVGAGSMTGGTATGGAGYAAGSASETYSAERRTGLAGDVGVRDRDGTIEVVEENLKVGKRDRSHGRVRVRSYVREDAVSEDVSLRSERVEIERRPVDRPLGVGEDAFRDQTLELEERSEEAVVSKDARVTEEIDLKTVGSERVETVTDTVRRTEVDIEDERGGRALTEEEVRLRDGRKL